MPIKVRVVEKRRQYVRVRQTLPVWQKYMLVEDQEAGLFYEERNTVWE